MAQSKIIPDGMNDWELIWENPSPTSGFAAQTLSLNLAKYGWVRIETRGSTSTAAKLVQDVEVLDDSLDTLIQMTNLYRTDTAAGAIYSYSRVVSATPTGITISDCSRRRLNTTSDSANSTQNGNIIPLRIWGKATSSSIGGDASFHDSGAGFRLLWTNPDHTATFEAQTISLDLSEYDAIWVCIGSTATMYSQALVPVGAGEYSIRTPSSSGTNVRVYFRPLTPTATGVTFGDATRFTQGTSGTTVVTNAMIPWFIYGVKFG